MARQRLVAGGGLYLFSQAPGWKTQEQAEAFGAELSAVLATAGLIVDETLVEDVGPAFAAGLVARASR